MKTLFFALGALALVGCKTPALKPVGPLAKDVPLIQQSQPLPKAAAPAPAVRPTPPTMFVAPGDVSATNPHDAANRLTAELTADSKPAVNGPVTAEVSRIGRQR